MPTVTPPAEEAADALQKLSIDAQTQSNTQEASDAEKKPEEVNGTAQSSDRSSTPVLPEYLDPTFCYYPTGYPGSPTYYYGGYDGSSSNWNDYTRYVSADGSGVYGDNASLMYPGYGFQPYGTYSPAGSVPTIGHDGQLYGPQHYQYATYYQTPNVPSGLYIPNQTPTAQGEGSTFIASAAQHSLPVTATNDNAQNLNASNSNGVSSLAASNPNHLNSNGSGGNGVLPVSFSNTGYQAPGMNGDGGSQFTYTDGSFYTVGQQSLQSNNFQQARNQNLQPVPNIMGLQQTRQTSGMDPNSGYANRMYPNNRYHGQFGATAKTGIFSSPGYDYRTNGRGWYGYVDNKYKAKSRANSSYGYSSENMDGFNELSRGPRSRGIRHLTGDAPVTLAVRGQPISSDVNKQDKDKEKSDMVPYSFRGQYNREDFSVSYAEAKFFIIKSYSEDDIHKSIKYGVWASTPNGNKKLDAGYKEAQEKSGALEKSGACPVFLFFSVNTSGQFVGLAEMVGPVDFDKSLDYWQQDKWTGCFPVKWHIIKDVPNSLLKHITLENNDNKPVTNSRDTQEVMFEQGTQMLKIFKDYSSTVCILDDFSFYESRQVAMQEKKAKQLQIQKQVLQIKPAVATQKENGVTNGVQEPQKSLGDGLPVPNDQAIPADGLPIPNDQATPAEVNGEHKQSDESVSAEDKIPNGTKSVAETKEGCSELRS